MNTLAGESLGLDMVAQSDATLGGCCIIVPSNLF